MTVTPTGLPAWTRTASIEQYGGHVEKENYLSLDAIDPLTDITAQGYSRLTADAMAAALTAPFAVITFIHNPGQPVSISTVYMMTGVRLTSYSGASPPSGFPGAVEGSSGQTVFTFASSYSDPYAAAGPFVPRHGQATAQGSLFTNCVVTTSGQTVTVGMFDAAGAALSAQRTITLVVY
jgi:hypothetical protein